MTGDQMRGSETIGEVEHRGDSHLAVTKDAGVGGTSRRITRDEATDDPTAKFLFQIEGEVRHIERVSECSGAEHGLRGTAGPGSVSLGIGPELDRHSDHLGATLPFQERGHGAIDSTRHRHQDSARTGRCEPLRGPRNFDQGAVQSICGELGAVALGRAQSTQHPLDLLHSDPGNFKHALAPGQLNRGRARRPSRAAALRVEARLADHPTLN